MLKNSLTYSEDKLGHAKFGRYELNAKDLSPFSNVALASLDMMSQQLPCKPMQDIGGMVNARHKHSDSVPNLNGV